MCTSNHMETFNFSLFRVWCLFHCWFAVGYYGGERQKQEKLPVKTDQDTLRDGYRCVCVLSFKKKTDPLERNMLMFWRFYLTGILIWAKLIRIFFLVGTCFTKWIFDVITFILIVLTTHFSLSLYLYLFC